MTNTLFGASLYIRGDKQKIQQAVRKVANLHQNNGKHFAVYRVERDQRPALFGIPLGPKPDYYRLLTKDDALNYRQMMALRGKQYNSNGLKQSGNADTLPNTNFCFK